MITRNKVVFIFLLFISLSAAYCEPKETSGGSRPVFGHRLKRDESIESIAKLINRELALINPAFPPTDENEIIGSVFQYLGGEVTRMAVLHFQDAHYRDLAPALTEAKHRTDLVELVDSSQIPSGSEIAIYKRVGSNIHEVTGIMLARDMLRPRKMLHVDATLTLNPPKNENPEMWVMRPESMVTISLLRRILNNYK